MFNSTEPMFLPLVLIMIIAPLGAIDLIYFHIIKFRLFERKESQFETLVHIIRNILFGTGAFVLLFYRPHGLWFWIIGALFLIDFLNSIVDVSIENNSRKTLGGLPTPEYIIHTVGSTFAGAITIAYFIQGWDFRNFQTGLVAVSTNAYPSLIQMNGYTLVMGSAFMVLLESFLLLRAVYRPRVAV